MRKMWHNINIISLYAKNRPVFTLKTLPSAHSSLNNPPDHARAPKSPRQVRPGAPRQSAQIPMPGQARRTTPERPNPHRPAAPRQPPQASRKGWPYYIRNVSLTWLPEPCRRSYIVGPALAAGLGRGGWPGAGRLTWPGAADLAGGG